MEDIKQVKQWWQSSNFWTALVLMAGGFFVGFPEETASGFVGLIFAIIAGGKTLQNYLTNANLDWRKWLNDANFWNYLGALLITIVPTLPVGLMDSLQNAVQAALGGNWQGMIIALFSLGTILYKVFKPQPTPATA